MENVSSKIDKFIAENGGNTRDALNVALARIELLQNEKTAILELYDDSESIGSLSAKIVEELRIRREKSILSV